MLTPTGNLQEWIDNQKAQVRSESDIIIEVWRYLNGTLSKLQTLDKKNIESYSINESASIVGFRNQSTNITFTVFKDGTTENNIKQGYFILICYRFYFGNSYSDVQKGFYEISKATVQNNGLVAKYEAKDMCYKLLESEWTLGGIPDGSATAYLNEISAMGRKIYPNMTYHSYGGALLVGYSTNPTNLTNRSILSLLTSIAQANGVMLRVKGFIDWNNNQYGLDIYFLAYNDMSPQGDYIVDYSNMLKKPENIESEYGYGGVSVKGTITTYRESQDEQPDKEWIEISPLLLNGNLNEIDWGKYPPYEEDGHTYHKVYRWDSNNNDWVLVHNDYPYGSDPVITAYTFTDEYLYSNYFKISVSPAIQSDYKFMLMYEAIYSVREYTYEIGSSNKVVVNNPFLNDTYNEYLGDSPNYTIFLRCASMFNTFTKKEKMEIECRFDPRVETLDVFVVEESSTQYTKCFLESYTMTYNGSYKGKMELLKYSNTYKVVGSFLNYDGVVYDTQSVWYGEPISPSSNPSFSSNKNAVYSSKTFTGWSPNNAHIYQNTTYTPLFNYTLRTYAQQLTDPQSNFRGQVMFWQIVRRTRYYRATPHIANFHALIGNPQFSIPSAVGSSVLYLTPSSQPTTFQGGEGADDWQYNRIMFDLDTTTGKYTIWDWYDPSVRPHFFCKGQDGKYWFATYEEIEDNNLEVVEFDTVDDELWNRFKYDSANDCFKLDDTSGSATEIYKVQ